jgi:TolB protein
MRRHKMIMGVLLSLTLVGALGCGDEEEEIDETRQDDAWNIPIELEGSLQNASWSPDGEAIVFTRFVEAYNEEPADLFIAEVADGSFGELVSDGSGNVNLPGSVWNEATEQIVFSSSRDPHDEIYVIDDGGSTGDEVRVTVRDDYVAYEPSFSPDGEWVVFESHLLDQEDNGVIMKFRVDGTGDYIALTDENDDCRQPNWAPAGDRILYQRFDGDRWDIWVMNDDGTGVTTVTDGTGDKTDASFSPDGDWIVYSSDEGELDLANIFIIPTVGGDSERVTEWAGYDGAPSWSPDGSRIAFESYAGDPDDSPGTTLWVVDAPDVL